jgi:hypothetical protein
MAGSSCRIGRSEARTLGGLGVRTPIDAFLQQKKRASVMQLILQPITEQYCERVSAKCGHGPRLSFPARFDHKRGKAASYATFYFPSQLNRR